MADLFPTSGQVDAQTPQLGTMGNLFGEKSAAADVVRQQLLARMQALQQAQLSPEQNGAFMAANAGNLLGGAAMQALSPAPPDPLQIKLAQIKQAVDAEGITDPEKYLRMAASKLTEAGLYPQAVEAQKQADGLAKSASNVKLQGAQTDEAKAKTVESMSNAAKNNQSTVEAEAVAPYKVVVERAKAMMTDPASVKALAEAAKATTETGVVKALADARIGQLNAEALKDKTISAKEAKQSDYELMGTLFEEKGAGSISPAREALLNAMIDIKSKPQTVVNSIMGGNKTADTFMNPGQAAAPALPGLPAAPSLPSVPKSPQSASGSILPKGIPAGSKQIGTSGGKPVYQTPDGRKLIVR